VKDVKGTFSKRKESGLPSEKEENDGLNTAEKIGVGLGVFFIILIIAGGLISFSEQRAEPSSIEFEVKNLMVTPSKGKVGEPIAVLANVTNPKEETKTENLTFNFNGYTETKKVELEGGENKIVIISHIIDKEGSYTVEVGGVSESFQVSSIDYKYEYDAANFVTVHYTEKITADKAREFAHILEAYQEYLGEVFGKQFIDAYLHRSYIPHVWDKTVRTVKTGFSSEHEITSFAEDIHESLAKGENVELRLLSTDGEMFVRYE